MISIFNCSSIKYNPGRKIQLSVTVDRRNVENNKVNKLSSFVLFLGTINVSIDPSTYLNPNTKVLKFFP